MKRYILLLISVLATLNVAFGQKVSYELQSPMSVMQGERFRVALVLTNAEGKDFVEPSITNADVLAGPTVATGTNISVVNGAQTTTTTRSYTYVLQAKSGNITIGSSKITADGKSYTTKSTTIEVLAEQGAGNSSGRATGQSMKDRPKGAGTMAADDILLRMDVAKTKVYKGEALCATLKIYTRVGISSLESPKYAAFNGFWAQELSVENEQPGRETINGKVYEAIPVRKWLLYPQRSGLLELEQNSFTVVAQVVTRSSGNSLFDEFFGMGSNVEHVRKQIASPSVKVEVSALPSPEPATFDDAVGQFTMEASISGNVLAANSAGSITLKLSGTGNFPLIVAPKITMPAGIELYDTKSSEQLQNTANGTTGTRTWEFPFVTRAEGKYTIPAIEISYFDTKSRSYKTLSSGDFALEVTHDSGSSSNTGGAFVSGVTRENLKMLGQDIRFIKVDKPNLGRDNGLILWSSTFFITILALAALLVAGLYFSKRYVTVREDVVGMKNKKANKVALRRLRKAKGYMSSEENEKFFEEMLRALWGYVGDKLAIEVAELTKDRVRRELDARGVNPDQIELFLELIGQCEMAQYAPLVGIPMKQAYEQALDIIGAMELK